MPIQVILADGRPFERTTTMDTSALLSNQYLPDRDRTAEPPRTIAVVATELHNAMDAASRVPRLRAELDALLGKKTRKSVAK